MKFVSQNKDTVLIVIINGRHLDINRLAPLVDAIQNNTSNVDYNLCVVLSNTFEENKKYLLDNNVFHINNEYNVGYSVAVNQGLSLAQNIGFEYVQVVSDDLVFRIDKNWLRRKVNFIKSDPVVGMITEKNWGIVESERFGKNNDYETIIAGACPFIRIKAVNDVGYMDNFYFHLWTDIDYCIRFNMFGWRIKLMKDPNHFVHRNDFMEGDGNIDPNFPNGADILEYYLGVEGRDKFISALNKVYPKYYEHKFKQLIGEDFGKWFDDVVNLKEAFIGVDDDS